MRSSDHRNRSTMENLLKFVSNNTKIETIIDIGASDGRWSQSAKQYFKNQKFHLLEANPLHEKQLSRNAKYLNDATFTIKVVGDKVGKVYFNDEDLFGGVASEQAEAGFKPYNSTCIDYEISRNNLNPPYLLKFDTHGFEKAILLGSSKALVNTNAIVMECYNFNISNDALLFWEMCSYLNGFGFRVADIVNQLYRPTDGFLWQMDILFLRSDREEFKVKNYNTN